MAPGALNMQQSNLPRTETRPAGHGECSLPISPDGRARLEELLSEERNGVDSAALSATYDDFRSVNGEFKALVTDWQLKGGVGGTPNTHDDAAYDDAVLGRLDDVH